MIPRHRQTGRPFRKHRAGPSPRKAGARPPPSHTPLPRAYMPPGGAAGSPTSPASGPRPPLPPTVHANVSSHSGRKAWSRRPDRGGEAPPVAAGEWRRRCPLEPPGHASMHPPAAKAIRDRARHGEALAVSRRRGGVRKETPRERSQRRPKPQRQGWGCVLLCVGRVAWCAQGCRRMLYNNSAHRARMVSQAARTCELCEQLQEN